MLKYVKIIHQLDLQSNTLSKESNMNLISWFQKVSIDLGSKLISRGSYKKGSSRPVGVDLIRMNYISKIFSVKFATLINSEYLFINIDEVSFSFKTKYDISWFECGWSN